jgi:predicted nucleic acid-binding protein
MILIDTGPLVALCNPRDALRQAAIKQLQSLAREGLCVCESVVVEACFHLRSGPQRQRLREILHQLHVTATPQTGDLAFWHDVLEWLQKYADHTPDWTDACIAVLCGRDPKLKVWTFDREFSKVWRRPDGSAIPLAIRG